nr:hypothetical protein [Tanacetum cinerariifolium]
MDGNKVIITESTIRRDLQLEDAEGVDFLPNAAIFEQLTLIGAKTTAWNEFTSTMASAIICLATNQNFNFSMYILESMVKNLDNVNKFMMYLRFVKVFLNNQLEGISNHNRIYVTPSHTKKISRNMEKVGKRFSRRETPLFPTMMVQAQQEMGKGLANPTDPQHIPIIIQPSTSQPQKTKQHRKPKRKVTEVPQPSNHTEHVADETVNEEMDDRTRSRGGPRCQETIEENVAQTSYNKGYLETTKTTQALKFDSLKRRVKKLERRKRSRTHGLKRLYKVGLLVKVKSYENEGLGKEDASKQGKISDIDSNEDIYLINVHNDEDMFDVDQDLGGKEVFVA